MGHTDRRRQSLASRCSQSREQSNYRSLGGSNKGLEINGVARGLRGSANPGMRPGHMEEGMVSGRLDKL